MRKNIKAIFLTLLSLLCFACFFVGCSKSGNSANGDVFKNFKDEEITVLLGENYRLELAPLTDGETYYEVTASVVDGQGRAVNVERGYFTIVDVNGYVITYSATNSGGSRNRTVTLKVKNERAPNVIIAECDTTYEVGETFYFPAVTVYDLADEVLTPTVGVYKVEGEERIEQILETENSFFCESAGEYVFKATAKNSFGVTGIKELIFYVNGSQLGEVEAFGNAGSKNDVQVNVKYTDGCEWIDQTSDAMGKRQGVLKVNVGKTNQMRNILTVYPKQGYAKYLEKDGEEYRNKKFVVTMYVAAPVGSIPEMYAHFTSYRIKDIKYNMWYDYSFDANIMLDAYNEILKAEETLANATDAQAKETAEKELQNLKNNTLSIWGTFTTSAVIYVDRIAFTEVEAVTSVETGKSYEVGNQISLATEMPVVGYSDVEYTVLLEGKPVAVTKDMFTPEYVSDNYTVVASLKGNVNELNDNAEFTFKTMAANQHTAKISKYTQTVSVGDEVIEPTIEIYDQSNNLVEGYKITKSMEFVSIAGARSVASSFTLAKSGTFEYVITAEKEGIKFIKTATVRVGPFDKYEIVSLARADVLELFGSTKATLLTKDELNGLKNTFVDVNETPFERVLRFTKNNSDKTFDLNFKPVHTLEYYKQIAGLKSIINVSLYAASANDKIIEFMVELFQDKECTYVVPANTWTTIEVPISAMISAMEDNRLYSVNTWTHWAIKIRPNHAADEYSIANSEFNLFLGDFTLVGNENGDNYAQDW